MTTNRKLICALTAVIIIGLLSELLPLIFPPRSTVGLWASVALLGLITVPMFYITGTLARFVVIRIKRMK